MPNIHDPQCRWRQTTRDECEYRATHNYCPHKEHKCTCWAGGYPPFPGRPSWTNYFLDIAQVVATRSDCLRRKVGAVIVKDHRIVSTGYNGAPAGEPGCKTCPRSQSTVAPGSSYDTGPGSCIAIHAEANALLYADYEKCRYATMYLTDWPCDGCMKLIRATGIRRVVTKNKEQEW